MTLHHTTHEGRGRVTKATVFQFGGTPKEKIVGHSYRRVDPDGGWLYKVKALDGTTVYDGEKISDGMAYLETHLAKAGE